jgi:hypothetical protein
MNSYHKFTELLAEPIDESRQEDLFCQICAGFLIKPYEHNTCGKLICLNCIKKHLQTSNKCPFCKEHISEQTLHFSKKAELFVMNTKVKCCNEGCTKIMTLNETDKHSCPYEKAPCPDCGTSICKNDSNHANTCPGVKCGHEPCNKRVPSKHLKKHMEECEYNILTCPYCQTYSQIRKLYDENHTANCDMRLIRCDKCLQFITARDHNIHMQDQCPERQVTCQKCNSNTIFKLKSYHDQYLCPYRMIKCSQCANDICFNQTDTHLKEQCIFRMVQCELCQLKMQHIDMQKHDCPESKINCTYCNEELKRKDQQNHLCPNELITCPHRAWCNCKFTCARKDMKNHTDMIDSHIELSKEYVANLEKQLHKSKIDSGGFVSTPLYLFDRNTRGNGVTFPIYPLYVHRHDSPLGVTSNDIIAPRDQALLMLKRSA